MPSQDDRNLNQNRHRTTPEQFDLNPHAHDLEIAVFTENTYHWLEKTAEVIHDATILPPDREMPFIDFNRHFSEYEEEYSDYLLTEEKRKENTEENLANRADRIIKLQFDETKIEIVKNTPGLEERLLKMIADFRKDGPLHICENQHVKKFLSTIEEAFSAR